MKKIISLASLFFLLLLAVLPEQALHAAAAANDNPVALTGITLVTDNGNINATQKGNDFTFDLVGLPGGQVIKAIQFTSPTATTVSFVPYDDPNYSDNNDLHFLNDNGVNIATLDRAKFDNWYQKMITSDPALSSQYDPSIFDQLFTVQGIRDTLATDHKTGPIPLYLKDAIGNESQINLTIVAEGWKYQNGRWYYYGQKGVKLTGWMKDGAKWYYLNSKGALVTGWVKVSNKWYYLNGKGEMETGWMKVSNKWYYLNSNGALATGWVKVSTKWYYLNSYGAMVTGWSKIGTKLFYFYSDGHMR